MQQWQRFFRHLLLYPPPGHRSLSHISAAIKKKQQKRVRDHSFDNYMETQKKLRRVLKLRALILQEPGGSIPAARLDSLGRRLGFSRHESTASVIKFPAVFEVFEHPVQRMLWIRLTRSALLQISDEDAALKSQIDDAVYRLRKLLMLSDTGRLRLEHLLLARSDFGLPDDFEQSLILKNPSFFSLRESDDASKTKFVQTAEERNPHLAVCEIERIREKEYRERGANAEDVRFAFLIKFPPGFEIGKYYKIAVWKWQRLPYWSPYDDVSGYDLRSMEAQMRMEKRAVAMIHELLFLTVEKKITLEKIAQFRTDFNLPKKLKDFLLQHQGIFYISTRGNQGKLHTIFLREAYKKGELVEPNYLCLARRKLRELVSVSPKKAKLNSSSSFSRKGEGAGDVRGFLPDCRNADSGEDTEDCSGEDSSFRVGFDPEMSCSYSSSGEDDDSEEYCESGVDDSDQIASSQDDDDDYDSH